ncbi:helix-turn-helix domain-containing protein [Glycomyces xiaoerkulensis]|uniref:helix-turn-helix domain-containing protein n=1 Tax=Glycomyces xiaoerkulensis TaxID=2038139 RepID=UPI000C259CA9|nr:helix-turn-helix domain-containing protein [Glycomyces xiaoerkulensis]
MTLDAKVGPSSVGTDEVWTVERVKALGVMTNVETAAQILGIGRTVAYRLAKEGDFPVQVLRIGHSYRVPVLRLLEVLGAEPERPE